MSQQFGNYTLLKKAKINPADGSVAVVYTVVETIGGRVIVDNLPTNLAQTVATNLAALASQYDYLGS